MTSTTAKAVLFDMKHRLDLIQRGMIKPSEEIKLVTTTLVSQLSLLPPDEKIRIVMHEGAYARWVLESTGKVLAEIRGDDDTEQAGGTLRR